MDALIKDYEGRIRVLEQKNQSLAIEERERLDTLKDKTDENVETVLQEYDQKIKSNEETIVKLKAQLDKTNEWERQLKNRFEEMEGEKRWGKGRSSFWDMFKRKSE